MSQAAPNMIRCVGVGRTLHLETCSPSLVDVRSQIVYRMDAGSIMAQRNAIMFK
jgi:hypothetical protein